MEGEYRFDMEIKRVQNRVEACLNKRLRDRELTSSQINVMIYLGHHVGEKITQRDIGDYLQVKHTSVIDILKRLEAKDMIGRCVDAETPRNNNVWLTDQGASLLGELKNERNSMEAVMVKGITPTEQDQLYRLLKIIQGNLDEISDQ